MTVSESLVGPLAAFGAELADAAGSMIIPHYRSADLVIEHKSDDSPVTVADKRAEKVMRELINARFPDHGIIGEEYGTERDDAEFVWMLDPIDGTISFAAGVPLFATLIALLRDGEPVLGIINQPVLNQLCIGNGVETLLNGHPVRIRQPQALSDATLLSTCLKNVDQHQASEPFGQLVNRVRVFRTWGDAYGYLLLATGFADIMVDPIMNPWDLGPLKPIIEGAGGRITDWNGNPVVGAASAVAAHPAIHTEVIDLLNCDV